MPRKFRTSRKPSLLLVIIIGLIFPCLFLSAHTFSVFDGGNPITLRGTIIKTDLTYPDSFVHVRVEDPSTGGKAVVWALMMLPPAPLKKIYELDASVLKEGETVTLIAWPEKPGANSTNDVQDPELLNRLKNERRGYAAQFEFSSGRKFPVVQSVPTPNK